MAKKIKPEDAQVGEVYLFRGKPCVCFSCPRSTQHPFLCLVGKHEFGVTFEKLKPVTIGVIKKVIKHA